MATVDQERPDRTDGENVDGDGMSRTEMYLELAKMSQESFFNRRSYEWKVAFGFWTAIGLVTYFVAANADAFSYLHVGVLGFIYLLLTIAWMVMWQVPLRLAFEEDKAWKHYYMHRAEGKPATRPSEYPIELKDLFNRRVSPDGDRSHAPEYKFELRRLAWTLGQTIFTIAFLIASLLAIGAAVGSPPTHDSSVEVRASGGSVKVQTETTK